MAFFSLIPIRFFEKMLLIYTYLHTIGKIKIRECEEFFCVLGPFFISMPTLQHTSLFYGTTIL